MEKLRECPFATVDDLDCVLPLGHKVYWDRMTHRVSCTCGASGMSLNTKEKSIDAWNTRHSDARIKELESQLQRVREFGVEEIEKLVIDAERSSSPMLSIQRYLSTRLSESIHAALRERIDGNKRGDMKHYLKIERQYMEQILAGRKKAEIRYNDRDYQTGDELAFNVIDKGGSIVELVNGFWRITHIHSGLGLQEGYVVLSIEKV